MNSRDQVRLESSISLWIQSKSWKDSKKIHLNSLTLLSLESNEKVPRVLWEVDFSFQEDISEKGNPLFARDLNVLFTQSRTDYERSLIPMQLHFERKQIHLWFRSFQRIQTLKQIRKACEYKIQLDCKNSEE
jgi:hypothetical protein